MSDHESVQPTQDKKTPGELLLEQYLSPRGIKFEKSYPGKRKKPDYTVGFEEGTYLLEVKDFTPGELLGDGGA